MDITELQEQQATILQLTGRLDASSSASADVTLAAVIGRSPTVILDLAGLDYVSSAGLRVLLKAGKQAQTAKQKLLLAGLRPSVQQVFEISGFSALFTTFASCGDALASVR